MSYRHIIGGMIVCACAAFLSGSNASAAGALALGRGDGAVWYGVNSGSGSIGEARANAMRRCYRHGPCHIATVFWNKCFALALQGEGHDGYGWAARDFEGAAQREAMRSCESDGLPCRIEFSACDRAGR